MQVNDDIPKPLPWEQRVNGTNPMPGGYSGYLDSLQKICRRVEGNTGAFENLVAWMSDEFSLSETSSRLRLRFLENAGLIYRGDGIVWLEKQIGKWLEDGEDEAVIAIMHSRVKFLGEMLHELREPKSTEQLRKIAAVYGLDWDGQQQINNRRGWLESAKLIVGSNQRLELTTAGQDLLNRIAVHQPVETTGASQFDAEPSATSPGGHSPSDIRQGRHRSRSVSEAEVLSSEILAASTASTDPTRFERAVRDGFRFMGFIAEHLGGSGKTDVLLTAPLGKLDLYRVAVDAKTTASGSLGDNQVDWETLKEHREIHGAKYSLLVAPDPTGNRLMDRARKSEVSVMSAEQLAYLCLGHARGPLGLVDYEQLFAVSGEIDPAMVDEKADQILRLRRLASAICRQLPEKTDRFGPMSARDVQLLLGDEADGVSEDEIKGLLDMLSHPLVGAVWCFRKERITGSKEGYVLATSRQACRRQIELLADDIDGFGSDDAEREA